jgi:hypothetical protein
MADYHGSVQVDRADNEHIAVHLDFIAGIGLYKLALGINDEDSQHVSAALQVQLAGIVGP